MTGRAVVVLAAGQSRRFGTADKLLAPLHGEPLCLFSARVARAIEADRYWAVVDDPYGPVAAEFAMFGLECLANPRASDGQGTSIAVAASAAAAAGMEQLVVLLADMPFVSAAHVRAVSEAGRTHPAVLSRCGNTRLPPASFQASAFAALAELEGDQGARAVLKTLETCAEIGMDRAMARDIDTEADWEAAQSVTLAEGARTDG